MTDLWDGRARSIVSTTCTAKSSFCSYIPWIRGDTVKVNYASPPPLPSPLKSVVRFRLF